MYCNEAEAKRLIIDAGHRLREEKPGARARGSISARIGGNRFMITQARSSYESLSENDLVAVNIDDGSYEGNTKPGREKDIHADAYSLRADAGFIIHTYRFFASVASAECRDVSFAPCAGYGLPGTSKLRRNVRKCIAEHPGSDMFLMARRGALLIGRDMEEALSLAGDLEEKCGRLVRARVPDRDLVTADGFDAGSIRIRALPYVTVAADPYIMECCRAGEKLRPYIDDFAQLVGPDMQVVENDARAAERALLGYSTAPSPAAGRLPMTGALDRMGGQHASLNSTIGRNAVLVKGVGAVCAGRSESEAEAVASAVSRNCAAACYVRRAEPVSCFDAGLLRAAYLSGDRY